MQMSEPGFPQDLQDGQDYSIMNCTPKNGHMGKSETPRIGHIF